VHHPLAQSEHSVYYYRVDGVRITNPSTLQGELPAFKRHLAGGHLSPKSVTAYSASIRKLAA
jgi:hypothetical protein